MLAMTGCKEILRSILFFGEYYFISMKFSEYEICGEIKKNLENSGFKKPTDIQYKCIPSVLAGEDVLAVAQTGTGKTAAFAIPIIELINRQKKNKRADGIKCIVMCPTRELAKQTGAVFSLLSKNTNVINFALYGGVEQDKQAAKIQKGIDVLISTPGRMFDLISQGIIDISSVKYFVLDEADKMLKLGFYDDLDYIKKMLKQRHQTMFFSATIDDEIKKSAYSQVKSSAVRIQISPKDPVSKNVKHGVMFVEQEQKRFLLQNFIVNNADAKIIVFVRTKIRAERVCKFLKNASINCETFHSEKPQLERERILNDFRENKFPVMIATDISARGIDIANVTNVVNYDLPGAAENYVHRIGRTGRGDKKGEAVSFCCKEEINLLKEIEKYTGYEITDIPVAEELNMEIRISAENDNKSLQQMIFDVEKNIAKNKKRRKK
ncbi:MAG: DEAD/DEAH box helicase [Chitinispirillales bacterium]|jgi:ATP-dependent RNA helicase RhlE|nr:DEAD/DEAH box helicase [Chitinispirillales bacterium]